METSKKFAGLLISSVMFIGTVAPLAPVLAETHPFPVPTNRGFCVNIEKHATEINQKVSDIEEKVDAKRQEHKTKRDAKKEEHREKITNRRSAEEQKHKEVFAKLSEQAKTAEQKAAVEKFVSTVNAAVGTRIAAADQALNESKDGIEAEFTARWNEIDAAHAVLKDATDVAFANARAACANNVDSKDVRINVRANLKAVREVYRDTVKSTDTHHGTVNQYKEIRKTAVHKAYEDYRTIVTSARNELKAAFGQGTE